MLPSLAGVLFSCLCASTHDGGIEARSDVGQLPCHRWFTHGTAAMCWSLPVALTLLVIRSLVTLATYLFFF